MGQSQPTHCFACAYKRHHFAKSVARGLDLVNALMGDADSDQVVATAPAIELESDLRELRDAEVELQAIVVTTAPAIELRSNLQIASNEGQGKPMLDEVKLWLSSADTVIAETDKLLEGYSQRTVAAAEADAGIDSEEWLILLASLVVEGLSVVFEQLGNGLLGFLMAVLGLLICVAEILYRAWTEKVSVEWVGKFPFLISTYPKYKRFWNTLQCFGLLAAVWQCFHATFGFVYARKHSKNPIKITITMFLLCLCLIVAKIVNRYTRRPLSRPHTV